MRILIDLIHPANIHYFKNFIFLNKNKGNEIIITARNKDVLQKLLNEYDLPYHSMGKGTIGKGSFGKMLYLIYAFFLMLFFLIRYRPKIVLSFGSTPCALASFLLQIPHIAFDDTEHARLNRKLYVPLTKLIVTPVCFYEPVGKNHFKFDGYMELFYLHPKRFKPDFSVLDDLGVKRGDPYILFRFVSWGAFHDIGQKRISNTEKIEIVRHFGKSYRIFISSEGELPGDLKKYELKIPAVEMHNVLAFSRLYIGEGGTMASEAAMLGIPSVYINSLPLMGYLKDCKEHGLLNHISDYQEVIEIGDRILTRPDYSEFYSSARQNLTGNKIDPTSLLEWLVNEYPRSRDVLLSDPDFQVKFR